MIVEAYGIKLKRLTSGDIEMVRIHRNSDGIRAAMEYRDYITAEMQREWFNSIDNESNNYMMILVEDHPIGLISGTQIDWERGITGNGGIFVWDKSFLETIYPAKASLLLTDIGFYLGMKKNYIRILDDNLKSISFNTALGYKLLPGQSGVRNKKYELTFNDYFKAAEKIRELIGAVGKIKITIDDANHVSAVNIVQRINNIDSEFATKIDLIQLLK
ncbi:MAG: hypothetical protein U0T74_13090 [Chitinophagales bacterium]